MRAFPCFSVNTKMKYVLSFATQDFIQSFDYWNHQHQLEQSHCFGLPSKLKNIPLQLCSANTSTRMIYFMLILSTLCQYLALLY